MATQDESVLQVARRAARSDPTFLTRYSDQPEGEIRAAPESFTKRLGGYLAGNPDVQTTGSSTLDLLSNLLIVPSLLRGAREYAQLAPHVGMIDESGRPAVTDEDLNRAAYHLAGSAPVGAVGGASSPTTASTVYGSTPLGEKIVGKLRDYYPKLMRAVDANKDIIYSYGPGVAGQQVDAIAYYDLPSRTINVGANPKVPEGHNIGHSAHELLHALYYDTKGTAYPKLSYRIGASKERVDELLQTLEKDLGEDRLNDYLHQFGVPLSGRPNPLGLAHALLARSAKLMSKNVPGTQSLENW